MFGLQEAAHHHHLLIHSLIQTNRPPTKAGLQFAECDSRVLIGCYRHHRVMASSSKTNQKSKETHSERYNMNADAPEKQKGSQGTAPSKGWRTHCRDRHRRCLQKTAFIFITHQLSVRSPEQRSTCLQVSNKLTYINNHSVEASLTNMQQLSITTRGRGFS